MQDYNINSLWSPHYAKDKALMDKIQHRFSRMIPEVKGLAQACI